MTSTSPGLSGISLDPLESVALGEILGSDGAWPDDGRHNRPARRAGEDPREASGAETASSTERMGASRWFRDRRVNTILWFMGAIRRAGIPRRYQATRLLEATPPYRRPVDSRSSRSNHGTGDTS